jgi:hypothetical protein
VRGRAGPGTPHVGRQRARRLRDPAPPEDIDLHTKDEALAMTPNDHHPARPRPADALFHQPGYRQSDWLETNWFSFIVPERSMRCSIYAGFRVNLGVAFSHITLHSGDCATVLDLDYRDSRVHLPIPPGNLDHYRLANGLEVKMLEAGQRWSVRYDDGRGTAFDLEATGLMRPVSSHEMTVAVDGADFSHFHRVGTLWDGRTGHIDQTMRMQGELILRGERIPVDCIANRDHSWAPRPEMGHGCGNFDEGFFGERFGFHLMTRNTPEQLGSVTNGYILDDGEPYAIRQGTGRYERDGWTIRRLTYEVEDVRGRSYVFEGESRGVLPIPSWPNQYNIASLVRWTHDGMEGWGEYKWHWELDEMIRRGGAVPA